MATPQEHIDALTKAWADLDAAVAALQIANTVYKSAVTAAQADGIDAQPGGVSLLLPGTTNVLMPLTVVQKAELFRGEQPRIEEPPRPQIMPTTTREVRT